MSYNARTIVDIVFIPIYAILLFLNLSNLIKHGKDKRMGFVFLIIFSLVRLVGNALLVAAYNENYDNLDVAKGGFICQGLGYTFLLNSTLSFLQRAKYPDAPSGGLRGIGLRSFANNPSPTKALHLLTVVGLILLIIGYVDSTDIFPVPGSGNTASDSTLNSKAKVGDVIFLVVTLGIAAIVFISIGKSVSLESKRLFTFILIALPVMLTRIVYVTYETFTTNPLMRTLWPRVVFEFVMEVIVVLIYFVMGFFVESAARQDRESMGNQVAYSVPHGMQAQQMEMGNAHKGYPAPPPQPQGQVRYPPPATA